MKAGMAIREGILRAKPDARIVVKPLADGGEGTTDALIEGHERRADRSDRHRTYACYQSMLIMDIERQQYRCYGNGFRCRNHTGSR